MEKAINNEIDKKFLEAVKGYEDIIENSSDATPDSFINLAFLYWCFAFELFEFVIPNDISEYWSNVGGKRFLKILELGLEKFPNNIELHFWEKYFLHISYGKEFSEIACLSLIEKYDREESLVPYFYLYLFDKSKYKEQRDELIKETIMTPSAKNLYIKSLLV